MKQQSAAHWVARVARRASWSGAKELVIPVRTPVADAWSAIMRACSVSEATLASAIGGALGVPLAQWETAEPSARNLVPEMT